MNVYSKLLNVRSMSLNLRSKSLNEDYAKHKKILVPVTVLNVDDDTVYGHDTGEIAESMLVRVFGIILLRFDENVVEIHIDGLTLPEQPHLHVEFHQQFVQL